jgi:hypothetical protein
MRLSLSFFIPLLATTFALPTRHAASGLEVRNGAELRERRDNMAAHERNSVDLDSVKREVGLFPFEGF